ncbi:MAG: hypothetical protein PVG71_08885 [Anaerolineae bacterium]|jgi:hypothetical protein
MEKQISSGLKTTFLVHGVLGTIFGLFYLLIPHAWGNIIGQPIEEPALFRLLGAAILAFTTSSWLSYREEAWERVKIVVQMEIVWTILATLVTLWGLIFAGLPALEWMNAVILGGFAVAFSIFYSRA